MEGITRRMPLLRHRKVDDLLRRADFGPFLTRPDGTKKAFARLTADVDALDIAATKLAIV